MASMHELGVLKWKGNKITVSVDDQIATCFHGEGSLKFGGSSGKLSLKWDVVSTEESDKEKKKSLFDETKFDTYRITQTYEPLINEWEYYITQEQKTKILKYAEELWNITHVFFLKKVQEFSALVDSHMDVDEPTRNLLKKLHNHRFITHNSEKIDGFAKNVVMVPLNNDNGHDYTIGIPHRCKNERDIFYVFGDLTASRNHMDRCIGSFRMPEPEEILLLAIAEFVHDKSQSKEDLFKRMMY